MSVRLMSDVFESDLPTTQRFVALVLADHADDDGQNAYPAIATIARKTGLGATTIRRALRDLETLGVIEMTAPANTSRRTAVYRIVSSSLPRPQRLSSERPRPERPPTPAAAAALPGQSGRGTPAAAAAEPSLEPSLTIPEPKDLALASRSRQPDLVFEALYAVSIGKPWPGSAEAGLTSSARSALNNATAQLKAAGATPEQIFEVPKAWLLLWPGKDAPTCTPAAIAKWWPTLMAAAERGYVARGADRSGADELREELEAAEAAALVPEPADEPAWPVATIGGRP